MNRCTEDTGRWKEGRGAHTFRYMDCGDFLTFYTLIFKWWRQFENDNSNLKLVEGGEGTHSGTWTMGIFLTFYTLIFK